MKPVKSTLDQTQMNKLHKSTDLPRATKNKNEGSTAQLQTYQKRAVNLTFTHCCA